MWESLLWCSNIFVNMHIAHVWLPFVWLVVHDYSTENFSHFISEFVYGCVFFSEGTLFRFEREAQGQPQ